MNVTNKNQLIITIEGKTGIYETHQVKEALKYYQEQQLKGGDFDIDKKATKELTKIYLAIPYRGMEQSSYDQATKAATIMLNSYSCNVFSPITHSHPIAKNGVKDTWEYWQQIDFQFIDWADEVWVLIPEEGIGKVFDSEGVKGELSYAKKNNKVIRYISVKDGQINLL